MMYRQCKPERHLTPEELGQLAKDALIEEVLLAPKPGLVDSYNTGSHNDLTVDLMVRSATCLEPYFTSMAKACFQREVSIEMRETIGRIGRMAEKVMMEETGGINTHRGAIWALGLLVSASATLPSHATNEQRCVIAGTIASLADQYAPLMNSNGRNAALQYKVTGAKEQAQSGFPMLRHHALPILEQGKKNNDKRTVYLLNTLLSIMSHLTDTCVLTRTNMATLQYMQQASISILNNGGVDTQIGYQALLALDKYMIEKNASPGGAADLLAASILLDSIEIKTLKK